MSGGLWLEGLNGLNTVAQHGDEALDFSQWNWEPTVVLGTALLVGVYLYGTRLLRHRAVPEDVASRLQVFLFLLGSLVLLLSLISPLDTLGDEYLFSAHMVQHILLATVVPLLLLLGTPGSLLDPLFRSRRLAGIARLLTFPVFAFLVFNVNFLVWHLPDLYDTALADEHVHILQHLSFLVTGVLNWWPVLGPLPRLPRLSFPLQLLYLSVSCQPGVVLGAILVFSRDVLYRAYLDAPRVFGISAYADQQIGGLIMWIPGNALYIVVLSVVFFRWLQNEENLPKLK